jgi:hypothetical protein
MFRLVKTPEGVPAFFLLCDHRQCMDARRGPAVTANNDDYRLGKQQFLKSAIEEGWLIDLEGTFCPPHAREILHAAQAAQERAKQIVEPLPAHVAAFGRGR